MYATTPLSAYKNGYKKSHNSFSRPIHEGPNSRYLLLQDDQEHENARTSSCFLCRPKFKITALPFPQNTFLTIYPDGDDYCYPLFFVPVINRPISSNRYYIIREYHGEALRCAKLEDKQSCCFFFTIIPDADPKPLDHQDIYQQFKVSRSKTRPGYFSATSVASDGLVPKFLRNEFEVKFTCTIHPSLGEAKGVDSSIRNCLPNMKFPLSSITVGKWWCPFMFIKDIPMKDQVKKSLFYEMTLEQRWERIYTCQNSNGIAKKTVDMDVAVSTQGIRIGGEEATQFEEDFVVGFFCIKGISGNGDELPNVGLSSVIVERMIWEEERVGWVRGDEKKVRIRRREEYDGEGLWLRFDCFVLVDRFVLKRMDGSLVLECDFKHTHQVKIKWS